MLLAAPQHANPTAFDHRVVPTGAYILRITLTGYRKAIRTVAGSRQEDIGATPEEVQLSDFIDGLGPQGISGVSLYRLLPTGITSAGAMTFSVSTILGSG